MRRTSAVLLSAALAVGGTASLSGAAVYSNGSKTATFDVTLKIIADATISANPLDFGQSQGTLQNGVTVNSSLQVTATNTTPYNVGLNAGTGSGSSTATRYLSGTGANSNTILFRLLQSAGGVNWGNTQGTDTVSGTGNGSAQTLTVYGVVPAQSTPQPDTYKSTITATVYF